MITTRNQGPLRKVKAYLWSLLYHHLSHHFFQFHPLLCISREVWWPHGSALVSGYSGLGFHMQLSNVIHLKWTLHLSCRKGTPDQNNNSAQLGLNIHRHMTNTLMLNTTTEQPVRPLGGATSARTCNLLVTSVIPSTSIDWIKLPCTTLLPWEISEAQRASPHKPNWGFLISTFYFMV